MTHGSLAHMWVSPQPLYMWDVREETLGEAGAPVGDDKLLRQEWGWGGCCWKPQPSMALRGSLACQEEVGIHGPAGGG